jgi:hypothetical protein
LEGSDDEAMVIVVVVVGKSNVDCDLMGEVELQSLN